MSNTTNGTDESREVAILTVQEAAARLGVSSQSIRRWVQEGRLPANRVGVKGVYRIKGDDLDRMVRAA